MSVSALKDITTLSLSQWGMTHPPLVQKAAHLETVSLLTGVIKQSPEFLSHASGQKHSEFLPIFKKQLKTKLCREGPATLWRDCACCFSVSGPERDLWR